MAEYNAADRKAIRAAEKAAATAEAQRAEVIVESMATVPRRRYVWDKLADCGIFRTTFSTDPLQMAFNEGQRNAGLTLLNDIIQYCPEQFIQAMREHNGRRSTDIPTAGSTDGERPDGESPGWDDQGRTDAPGIRHPGPEDA
jgi:hypothetical protein